jgi:hypothetical protein
MKHLPTLEMSGATINGRISEKFLFITLLDNSTS